MQERLLPNIDLLRTVEVLRFYGVTWDIDGVDVNNGRLSVDEYNRLHGRKIKRPRAFDEAKHYWILVDWISHDPSVSDPRLAAINIFNSQFVMENAPMVPGTRTVSEFLARRGIIPPRVTARPGARTRDWTYAWYRKMYRSNFDLNLIHMSDTDKVDPEFKRRRILKLGRRFHFDDSYEEAERLAADGITVALVPQPWNEDYIPTNPNIITAKGYPSRYRMVRAFLSLAEKITQSY
jgi:hypothetical protein